ncbi:popeye domain-containing protein, partial [Pseudomonadota bacterium]|nr:popeye domain-containing protein [Pseudomonadota bacterium]
MDNMGVILVGNLSFAAAAFSFLMKDIILLRVIAILSSMLGIIYNFFAASEPLWLVIFWLSVFVIINLYQTISTLFELRMLECSDTEMEIRNVFFKQLSLIQFKKLINLGNHQ